MESPTGWLGPPPSPEDTLPEVASCPPWWPGGPPSFRAGGCMVQGVVQLGRGRGVRVCGRVRGKGGVSGYG